MATATDGPTQSISPQASHSATSLALGVSLAVLATLVFGGLGFYFVRRRYRQRKTRARAEEIHAHRRTYMVAVDPTHLAARVTPFGVGVNAPDVQMPKFGEFSSIFGLFCWVFAGDGVTTRCWVLDL